MRYGFQGDRNRRDTNPEIEMPQAFYTATKARKFLTVRDAATGAVITTKAVTGKRDARNLCKVYGWQAWNF
jgi:hypothetical protein